jgi:EAL domain-containing protein (putative c-di-GMP-specific phosphodiesterase class I)/ActR/RegA family two-component response regulator
VRGLEGDVEPALTLLARVAAAIAAGDGIPPEEAIEVAARELCQDPRHPLVRVWYTDDQGRLSLAGTWVSAENLASRRAAPAMPPTAVHRAATTRAAHWANFTGDGEEAPAVVSAMSIRSTVTFPICSGRRVMAVLEVFCTRPVEGKDDQLVLAGTILGPLLSPGAVAREPLVMPRSAGGPEEPGSGELVSALERGEFSLVYQPQVSLESDRVIGAEALLRWIRPDGPASPMSFIPLAEATGEIIPIGAWVIREACLQAARWQERFPEMRPFHISVNVSPRQFRADLLGTVQTALAATGLEPGTLRLELTETMLIEDVEFARATLDQLCDIGVTLSLDDFGTGYSSLAYFQQLPLDEVKVDRAFVDGLGVNRGDNAIVASILSLAHALERTVVAEGVETFEQLEHLRSLGCDVAQGFLFARGLEQGAFEGLLTRTSPGFDLAPEGLSSPAGPSRLPSVLVIDDSAIIRELATMCLSAAGFSVSAAETGTEGLAAARERPPDALLLDMHLPDTSGIELCAALRSEPATAGCTIVMLTSADDHAVKAESFKAGADDYVVKPFIPRDLAHRVYAAMRRRLAA